MSRVWWPLVSRRRRSLLKMKINETEMDGPGKGQPECRGRKTSKAQASEMDELKRATAPTAIHASFASMVSG